MSEKIFKILLEEFKRNGVKLIEHDFRCDVFISDPADIIHETFERQCTTIPQLLDFSEHDKVFEDKISQLEKDIVNYKQAFEDKCKDYDFILELLNKFDAENESLNQRIAELESKNEQLKFDIDKMATSKSEWIDKAVEWQQKCEKLESKETDTNNDWGEPYTEPNIEWYDNRHQSDCIEINRLNTTIDVLIHKVEYLRQFAGLE